MKKESEYVGCYRLVLVGVVGLVTIRTLNPSLSSPWLPGSPLVGSGFCNRVSQQRVERFVVASG